MVDRFVVIEDEFSGDDLEMSEVVSIFVLFIFVFGGGKGIGGVVGKRKRVVDDDLGYRFKGGFSWLIKKKCKSEGGGIDVGVVMFSELMKRLRKSGGLGDGELVVYRKEVDD